MSVVAGAGKGRSVKRQKQLEYQDKLRLIDAEFMSFYQYCQQAGFTEAEMEVICAPLLEAVRRSTLKKTLKWVLVLAALVASFYWLSTLPVVKMHFTAVGRILLIKARTDHVAK